MPTAIQVTSFAFMMEFLPKSAYDQYRAAQDYELINSLGRPDVASFAAYGYSAGPHIDKDVCVSHGWVFSRPKEVRLKCFTLRPHLRAFDYRSSEKSRTSCTATTSSSLSFQTTPIGFGTPRETHMGQPPTGLL